MTRLLITGGSSYLGQHLVPLALQRHYTLKYTFFSNDPLRLPLGVALDIQDETAVAQFITFFQPDVIIHTVGSNRDRDFAEVIRRGTRNVVQAAESIRARVIHLSTDAIFDGRAAPYDESAAPTPVNEYGRAKADAEAIVQQLPHHVIVRTSLIYGLKQMDRGTAWMVEALQTGQPVTLFTNQIRNPVWVQTLSRACLELVESDFTGVLNVVGGQALSRADFALKMLDWWGISQRDTLTLGLADEVWPLNGEMAEGLGTAVLQKPLLGVDEEHATKKRNQK
jgi:dTDP-4-dehydrorhamnose reductase